MHDIVTVSRATNTELTGAPSAEYSWFPGYTWTIAVCASCMAHVGWRWVRAEAGSPRNSLALSRCLCAGSTRRGAACARTTSSACAATTWRRARTRRNRCRRCSRQDPAPRARAAPSPRPRRDARSRLYLSALPPSERTKARLTFLFKFNYMRDRNISTIVARVISNARLTSGTRFSTIGR